MSQSPLTVTAPGYRIAWKRIDHAVFLHNRIFSVERKQHNLIRVDKIRGKYASIFPRDEWRSNDLATNLLCPGKSIFFGSVSLPSFHFAVDETVLLAKFISSYLYNFFRFLLIFYNCSKMFSSFIRKFSERN